MTASFWAISALLFTTFLFLIFWVHERNRRIKLQGRGHSYNANTLFELAEQHHVDVKHDREKQQELRAVMLGYALRNAKQLVEVQRLNKALQRRNAAARTWRDRAVAAEQISLGWGRDLLRASHTVVRLCDVLPPSDEVSAIRKDANAMASFLEAIHPAAIVTKEKTDSFDGLNQDRKDLDEVTLARAQNDAQ